MPADVCFCLFLIRTGVAFAEAEGMQNKQETMLQTSFTQL